MLNAKELKAVVSTLTKRRAWLRKSLEDTGLDPEVRQENVEALSLLDSAVKKLAATSSAPPKPKAAKPAAPQGPVPISEARLLVAEDNDDSAKLLLDILEDMGIKMVDYAKDGIEAFEKIKKAEDPYHIILCDWDMPGLTGIEVHSKAKASNTLRNAHFVMVTAVTEAPRIKQAVQQGVNDYIVKPIDIDKLEGKITAALNAPGASAKKQA